MHDIIIDQESKDISSISDMNTNISLNNLSLIKDLKTDTAMLRRDMENKIEDVDAKYSFEIDKLIEVMEHKLSFAYTVSIISAILAMVSLCISYIVMN